MPTAFQTRVYAALKKIPRGRVSTYALVARHVGCRSARAIGQALKRNPFAPVVPCHRVIASDLSIGGFNGNTTGAQVEKKIRLLRSEGVSFRNGELADPGLLFDFDRRDRCPDS